MSQKSFKESRKSNATFSLVEVRRECSVYSEQQRRKVPLSKEVQVDPKAEAKRILNAKRDRIHELLDKRKASGLTKEENEELQRLFAEVDAPNRGKKKTVTNRSAVKLEDKCRKEIEVLGERQFLFAKEVREFESKYGVFKRKDGKFAFGGFVFEFERCTVPINTYHLVYRGH